MAGTFSDLILSNLFTFHVGSAGEKKHAIQVHSKAIAATCDYMRNLIEGDMKEAIEGAAEQDVKLEDFVRFVEYAYRGDFTAPSCVLEESSAHHETSVEDAPQAIEDVPPTPEDATIQEAPPPEPEPNNDGAVVFDDGWGDWGAVSKKKKKKAKSTGKASVFRTEHFNRRNYLSHGDPQEAIAIGCAPISNSAPEEDYTHVFLTYVRLYNFAEMRLMHNFKALTLHKLHCTLRTFTLYPERIGDVVELARQAYETTPSRTADDTIDELRKLVVDYIACESAEIGRTKEFKRLLEDEGEFASDFWDVISSHII